MMLLIEPYLVIQVQALIFVRGFLPKEQAGHG